MQPVSSQKARIIANRFPLNIYQEYACDLDGITSIQIGSEKVVKNYLWRLVQFPIVYYSVRETDEYFFINYVLYHPFDWAKHDIPVIGAFLNKLDSHRHDTESVCLRVHRETDRVDMVTTAHYSHIFAWDTTLEVIVKSKSHAIYPKEGDLDTSKSWRPYPAGSYRMENFEEWSPEKLAKFKEAFAEHGVNWIDGQYDDVMKLQTATGLYRSQGLQHLIGDIYNDPEKLFEIGEKLNR